MEQFHPLDRLICDNSFALLEALVPFVDYPYKQLLVIYIKYKEALSILHSFNDRTVIAEKGFDCHPKSTEDFLVALCKILPPQYSNNLQSLQQMFHVMQMMDKNDSASKNNIFDNISYPNQQRTYSKDSDANNLNLFHSVMDILNENN